MENKKKVAKEHFDNYPKIDAFYITSDEQAFFTANDAHNHAQSLKDGKVVKAIRGGFDETEGVAGLHVTAVYVDRNNTELIEQLEKTPLVKVIVTEKSAIEKVIAEQDNPKEDDGLPKSTAATEGDIANAKGGNTDDKKAVVKGAEVKKAPVKKAGK